MMGLSQPLLLLLCKDKKVMREDKFQINTSEASCTGEEGYIYIYIYSDERHIPLFPQQNRFLETEAKK